MDGTIADRVGRERAAYDEGLDRGRYRDLLVSHAGHLSGRHRTEIARRAFAGREVRRVLELGCQAWHRLLEDNRLVPGEVVCVNISDRELDAGRELARDTLVRPTFRVMDAHRLEYPDGHFDAVIGWGILHHLDLPAALAEIRRVLRPGGLFMFSEPLDDNPVARLVRRATPKARTADEVPFRAAHLATVREHFRCELHHEQLLSVPAGILSRLLFRGRPDNALTRAAHRADLALRRVPGLGRYFRKVTIVGTPRAAAA